MLAMDDNDDAGVGSGGRRVARRASPVLAVVALAWVLRKLLSRRKD